MKHRISDFIVNEIDSAGNVVKLTDMRIEVVDASKEGGNDEANNNADAKDKLIGLIGREKYDQINAMIEENLAAQSAQKEADGGEDERVKAKVREV